LYLQQPEDQSSAGHRHHHRYHFRQRLTAVWPHLGAGKLLKFDLHRICAFSVNWHLVMVGSKGHRPVTFGCKVRLVQMH